MTRTKFFTRLGEVYVPWIGAYVTVCWVLIGWSTYAWIYDWAVITAGFGLMYLNTQRTLDHDH